MFAALKSMVSLLVDLLILAFCIPLTAILSYVIVFNQLIPLVRLMLWGPY